MQVILDTPLRKEIGEAATFEIPDPNFVNAALHWDFSGCLFRGVVYGLAKWELATCKSLIGFGVMARTGDGKSLFERR